MTKLYNPQILKSFTKMGGKYGTGILRKMQKKGRH